MPSHEGRERPTLIVKVQSSRDGINGVTPELKSLTDLYRLVTSRDWVSLRQAKK
jgi:hypothetical protein